jgi:trehalose-phosphatase
VELRDDFSRLADAHRAGQHLAVLLDYDGTLAPPVTHPALARCPESTAQLLAQFADLPRVGVGILSNRTMTDLKSLVRLPKLSYVGTSGLEIETKGLVIVHPRAQRYRPYLEHAMGTIHAVIAPFDGAWLEDKTLALTVHYLAVNRDDKALLRQCLNIALDRYAGLLTAVDGAAAMEVLPDIGWAKGDTVRQIIESPGTLALPLYAGSDASDEQAFQLTAEAGGVTIGIGPFAPHNAMHHIPDPESLAGELSGLLSLLTHQACAAAKVRSTTV